MMLATPSLSYAADTDPRLALRVMSFNIRYVNPKDGPDEWKFRKELFVETVRAFAPDLLGTQEVVASQMEDLRTMLPGYTAIGVARDDGKREGEWSAVFFLTSRFEEIASGNFWLSEQPDVVGSKGWDGACVRICTWARLRDRRGGRELVHANTHFDHEGKKARLGSAELLRARLPLMANGAPVILTGDFNCGEEEPTYRVLTAKERGGFTLLDSYRELQPQRAANEGTFHGFKGTTSGERIDWILHTPHFKAISAEIVRGVGKPFPSDHFPVTAVLEPQR